MSSKIKTYCYDPAMLGPIPADGSADAHPFEHLTVQTGGSPSVTVSGNKWRLALDNTEEVQVAVIRMANGNLPFDIDDIKRFRIWLALSTALGSAASFVAGLADDTATDFSTVVPAVLYGASGSSAITVQARDGTNTLAATATGNTLATGVKKFTFDFSEGTHSQDAPDLSVGGKSKILGGIDNAYGEHQRFNLGSSRINLGAYTGSLMPVVQIQKTSSTDVGTLDVYRIELDVSVAG